MLLFTRVAPKDTMPWICVCAQTANVVVSTAMSVLASHQYFQHNSLCAWWQCDGVIQSRVFGLIQQLA